MATAIKAIPAGYEAVTPYLVVKDAAAAIDFYKKAFNATELMRYDDNGRIGHAELQIGEGRFMLADEYPEMGYTGPRSGESPAVGMMFYVEEVDAVVERAEKAGASIERPVADQFYGDRSGQVIDPFGHRWTIATHVEDVSPEEMERRTATNA
ncbi:MAG: VOC family protein [Woeseia sp.]